MVNLLNVDIILFITDHLVMPGVLLKLEVVVNVFIWNILSTEKEFSTECEIIN